MARQINRSEQGLGRIRRRALVRGSPCSDGLLLLLSVEEAAHLVTADSV